MVLALLVAVSFQGAGDVLMKFAAAENAAKTLTASCTQQRIVATGTNAPATPFTITLAKPNLARIDLADRLIVADGSTITVLDKDIKTYMKQPQTDASLKALFANNELGLFGAFFDATFFDKVRTGKVGKRSRRGVSYDVVDTEMELDGKQTVAFYLDPADKMMKMGEFTFAQDGETQTLVISAKEFSIGAPQTEGLYAFKAPEGASEITPADLAKANTFVVPPVHFDKAMTMMHLFQCDPRGSLPNGGKMCCGPTAASLAMTYVGQNGYPKLFQGDEVDALGLVGTMADAKYMGTDPSQGTGPHQILRGLVKYIGDTGYRIQEIGWQSWRSLDRATKGYKVANEIDFDWVRRGIAMPNSMVLFNIGWYNADGKGNYNRYFGHWVAAAGYGSTGSQEPNPLLFLIRDPGMRTRDLPKDPKDCLAFDVLKLTAIPGGNLTGKETGLPMSAKGHYFVGGPGVAGGGPTITCILDGVIVIVLKPAK
jgi:outer membrane lipoprotein-sorting protein